MFLFKKWKENENVLKRNKFTVSCFSHSTAPFVSMYIRISLELILKQHTHNSSYRSETHLTNTGEEFEGNQQPKTKIPAMAPLVFHVQTRAKQNFSANVCLYRTNWNDYIL